MKTIYCEAKQHLSSCMLQSDDKIENENISKNTANGNGNGKSNHNYIDNSPIGSTLDDDTTPTLGLHSNRYHSNYNDSNFIATADTTTSTYDTLQRPFKYDKLRGQWSSAADFYFVCTSHAFGSVISSELPVYAMIFSGGYFFPAYLIAILLYSIPIFVIQTFLGQFSTSGTISALRVTPIFKGLGYSILFLNLISLAYYGVIAAIPLIYAANSLHTVIPWMSCDNAWNTVNCSTHDTYDEEEELPPHATVEFFRSIIRTAHENSTDYSFSWPILCGVIGVWLLTLAIILKRISFIGKLFRCVCIVMFTCFFAIFVHVLQQAEISWSTILSYFTPILGPSMTGIIKGMRTAVFMATWVLGPGWGSVLTMASFNNFRRDSEKLTYWISATHVLIAFVAIICGRIAMDHFEDHVGMFHFHVEEDHHMQFLYLTFAYLFGSFESLPNFWSFLFFGMLFIGEVCAMIIQMISVLTALFDEHEKLRTKKTRVTILLSLCLFLMSIYFCTKQGFKHLHHLSILALLSHIVISVVLLMITVWIYGRARFQCDLQYMLGKTISNFKIFLLRFITPAFLVLSIFQILFLLENEGVPYELIIFLQSLVYIITPAYMIYKLCYTTGSWRSRIKQCLAPHDWHPVDVTNRRFYEEMMGTSEMLVISDNEIHEDVP